MELTNNFTDKIEASQEESRQETSLKFKIPLLAEVLTGGELDEKDSIR